MEAQLKHASLNATLKGVRAGNVQHFRGVPYAHIPARFARSEPLDDWQGKEVECTDFGPKCPQNYFDVGHLLRIPEDQHFEKEEEDEFKCVNLDVAMPAEAGQKRPLPVLIWIHGGSQIMTFGSTQSRICDTTKLVAESIEHGKPMIVVSLAYRLNIFAFGDGKGERNLALKDQRVALNWVQKHIGGFGGDPNNVTLAGESAGGVYVHAHVVTGAPLRRAVLASGSLYLSPPQPPERGNTLIDALQKKLQSMGHSALKNAPVDAILKAQSEMALNSLWLQEEPGLTDWEQETGNAQEVMVGDCEYESVLWRNGIETTTAATITDCFNQAGGVAAELKRLYSISESRPTPSKLGALDFMNDMRFALPVLKIGRTWRNAGKHAYSYVVDQANPWQASSRAHHAVDLLLLFGGLDLSFSPAAETVGKEMRRRWISFVAGEQPWSPEKIFAFGPLGESKEIDSVGLAARRRLKHMEHLERMEPAQINAVFGSLAAGRISLLN